MKEWRRKFIRIRCFKPPVSIVPILLHFGQDKRDGWGTIIDISMGGIGVETRMPVKLGQSVYVSFTLAGRYTFASTKAVIRRVVSGGMYSICGIEFESLVDRQHLQDALGALAELEEKGKLA